MKHGPEVIKLFSLPTQLSMKVTMLINVKMPTVILTFISMVNTTSESLKTIKVFLFLHFNIYEQPGRVGQSVTCLATDACLTADPGVASSIPARSHTFVENDHEIISTVILLPFADSFMKGCCQLQAKVCAQITGEPLVQACPGKSVVR